MAQLNAKSSRNKDTLSARYAQTLPKSLRMTRVEVQRSVCNRVCLCKRNFQDIDKHVS